MSEMLNRVESSRADFKEQGSQRGVQQIYAMNGEVIGNIAVTVQFPEDPFWLTLMVRKCTVEQIDNFLTCTR